MRMKLKKWSIPFLVEHPEVYFGEERYQSQTFIDYINKENLHIEVGPGKGDFVVQMATKYPTFNFLVIELNVSVAAMTAVKIVEAGLNNVKLIQDDALVIFPLLNEHSVEAIFLNFSDPWPKKRHEKRRLTSPRFLAVYERVLKKGAPIIQKTDQKSLYEFSLETYLSQGWKVVENIENYVQHVEFDAMTEYEQNFRQKGHQIYRLVATRE